MTAIEKIQELIDKKIPVHFETVNEGDLYDLYDGELTWNLTTFSKLKFENIVNEVYERAKRKYPEKFQYLCTYCNEYKNDGNPCGCDFVSRNGD